MKLTEQLCLINLSNKVKEFHIIAYTYAWVCTYTSIYTCMYLLVRVQYIFYLLSYDVFSYFVVCVNVGQHIRNILWFNFIQKYSKVQEFCHKY